MERTNLHYRSMSNFVAPVAEPLLRDAYYHPLKHWRARTRLDHPELPAADLDGDIKAWTTRKGERAGTIRVHRVRS